MTRPAIKKNPQGGFTMIELVFVIVILGILAAFAVPRFINLTKNARQASVQGLAGSVQSASALVHAQFLVNGSSSGNVTMDGQPVHIEPNGFPSATSAGIVAALQSVNGYNTNGTGSEMDFTLQNGGKSVSQCGVVYTNAGNAGTSPVFTTNISGC